MPLVVSCMRDASDKREGKIQGFVMGYARWERKGNDDMSDVSKDHLTRMVASRGVRGSSLSTETLPLLSFGGVGGPEWRCG
jgi:hypothetical protein